MAEERPRVDARLLGIAERFHHVRHGRGEDAIVRKTAETGLDEMERGGGLPRPGRTGQHRGAPVARYRGGVEEQVSPTEHDLGVTVVDEVDALVQIRADVAGREGAAEP